VSVSARRLQKLIELGKAIGFDAADMVRKLSRR
jgi:hypothetical protein